MPLHQTRFVRLHETRAEIIAELYKRLVKAEDAIYTLLGDVQPAGQKEREELFQSTGELTSGLVQFFQEHRIYFDEELCARLEALALNLQQAWLHGSPYVTVSPERREQTQNRLNEIAKVIPLVRDGIEARFREMLGVNSGSEPETPTVRRSGS